MDYHIIRVTEEPTFENGKADSLFRVEFTVGDDGPFYERIPKADFSELTVQQRLGERARVLLAIRR